MSPFVVHRRKEAYGDDAETFRPERWLETTEDEKRSMVRSCRAGQMPPQRLTEPQDHNLLTFGHGPRICIGRNVSIAESESSMVPVAPRELTKMRRQSPRSCLRSSTGTTCRSRRARRPRHTRARRDALSQGSSRSTNHGTSPRNGSRSPQTSGATSSRERPSA